MERDAIKTASSLQITQQMIQTEGGGEQPGHVVHSEQSLFRCGEKKADLTCSSSLTINGAAVERVSKSPSLHATTCTTRLQRASWPTASLSPFPPSWFWCWFLVRRFKNTLNQRSNCTASCPGASNLSWQQLRRSAKSLSPPYRTCTPPSHLKVSSR